MQASFGASIFTDGEVEFREGGPNDQRDGPGNELELDYIWARHLQIVLITLNCRSWRNKGHCASV